MIGYVDPVLIATLSAAMYLIARREQNVPIFLLSALAAGINEKYIIFFPFGCCIWLDTKRRIY
jgi:hypothetical protein